MIQKSTTHACIITLLIISSIVVSGVPIAAQSQGDSLHINTSREAVGAVYHEEADLLIVGLDQGGFSDNDALAAYDQNGNQVWERNINLGITGDMAYNERTQEIIIVGSNNDNIRRYDSDGDYQGGTSIDTNGHFASMDGEHGNVVGFRKSFDSYDIVNTTTGQTEYSYSNQRHITGIYEPKNYALTGDTSVNQNNGNSHFNVYNYTTNTRIIRASTSPMESQTTADDDYWDLNADYAVLQRGMYSLETGNRDTGWGQADAVEAHQTQNIGYAAFGGEIRSYTASGGHFSTQSVSSGYMVEIRYQEFNGGGKILYAGGSGAGYVEAQSPPTVSGTVSKSVQNTVSPLPNANVTMYDENGDYVADTTTDGSGGYSITTQAGDYSLTANKSGWTEESTDISLPPDTTQNFTLENKSALFNFQVANFMEHGDKTPYSATYEGSGYTKEPVTDDITVTSGNTSIVTVDSANNSLQATSNRQINNRTEVTATYVRDGQEYETTQEVTVANLTIDNIAIMPPEQWVPAVLGFGEEETVFGLGSEIQWILVSIFTGGSAAWFARNEWMGIGVIVACLTLFWTLGNIDLGIMLVAVSYAAFAGYQLNRIPSRSDTNVGGGMGGENQEYSRPADRYQE